MADDLPSKPDAPARIACIQIKILGTLERRRGRTTKHTNYTNREIRKNDDRKMCGRKMVCEEGGKGK
jgi:hypothetical protein